MGLQDLSSRSPGLPTQGFQISDARQRVPTKIERDGSIPFHHLQCSRPCAPSTRTITDMTIQVIDVRVPKKMPA